MGKATTIHQHPVREVMSPIDVQVGHSRSSISNGSTMGRPLAQVTLNFAGCSSNTTGIRFNSLIDNKVVDAPVSTNQDTHSLLQRPCSKNPDVNGSQRVSMWTIASTLSSSPFSPITSPISRGRVAFWLLLPVGLTPCSYPMPSTPAPTCNPVK